MSVASQRKKAFEAQATSVANRFQTADAVMTSLMSPTVRAEPDPASVTRSAPRTSGDFEGAPPREIRKVALDLIDDNMFNARHVYLDARVQAIALSLAADDQIVPALAVVHPEKPGRYMLIDGHYRKRGALLSKRATLDLDVKPFTSSADLYKLSFRANEERTPQSILDNAFAWQKLLDDGVVPDEQAIATMLQVGRTTVNKTLQLLKLPPAALVMVADNALKIGSHIAYELTLLSGNISDDALLDAIKKILEEDMSSREVVDFRKALLAQVEGEAASARPARARKRLTRTYKIMRNGKEVGFLKDWDSGQVSFQVATDDPEAREALLADLKARFEL